MWSFLLFILSLITDCEVLRVEVKCKGGWLEFTCKYPREIQKYSEIKVVHPNGTLKRTIKNPWENIRADRFSLFHDRRSEVKVVIRQFESGKYKCRFYKKGDSSEEEDIPEHEDRRYQKNLVDCQGPFTQTAYRTARITITCDNPENPDNSQLFLCKENNQSCEDISSMNASPGSDGTFTATKTNSGLSVSIDNVSPHNEGVYWCAVDAGRFRAGLKKIDLQVKDITSFNLSGSTGQTLTTSCQYPLSTPIRKFFCKGEDPSTCERLTSPNTASSKFSSKDFSAKHNITLTIRNLTRADAGTYWCGTKAITPKESNRFFCRIFISVDPASAAAERDGDIWLTVIIICIAVLVLLVLVFTLVLVCTCFRHLKINHNGDAQNNREDATYEEIQERPQKTASGTEVKTVYATASFPTNPSSQHHDEINSQNLSAGDGLTYSTSNHNDQCPTYSTVNHPSEDPVNSVENGQQAASSFHVVPF